VSGSVTIPACNACNAVKSLVPVSQVCIVLAIKNWDKYTVAKRVFFNDRMEHCEELYHLRCTVGFWYEISKKYVEDFFICKHCNTYKMIPKRLKRVLFQFRCSKTQDLTLQMGRIFFQF